MFRSLGLWSVSTAALLIILPTPTAWSAPALQLFGELGAGNTFQTVAYDESRFGLSFQLGAAIGADWEAALYVQSYRESLGENTSIGDTLFGVRTRYRPPFFNKKGFLGLKVGRLSQSQTFEYDPTLGNVGGEPLTRDTEIVKNKTGRANLYLAPEIGIDHQFGFLPKVTFSLSAEMPIYLRNGVSGMFNTQFAVRYTL